MLVQSSSAAGKSSLMDAVLAFVPEEERIQFSAMTGQSLYYMGEMDLKHKVLAIVEEEGASRAAYALKLLQSEGALSIASTGKDPATGKLVTHQYRVEGPVMMFLTTTAIDIDEELLNRCLVLSVNEDREQTQAIHKLQREQQTLAGLIRRAGAARYHPPASERAAIVEAAVRGEPVRRYTDVSRPAHAHAARSHEVPDAHPRDRALAPASTAGENRTVQNGGLSYIEATREDIATADRLMEELHAPFARRAAAADAPLAWTDGRDGERRMPAAQGGAE